MSVSKSTGLRGKCDLLFSRIIRSPGTCVRCGAPATDCAHIISRRFSATRCHEHNAWPLCRGCHNLTGLHAGLHMQLVAQTIGEERYWELYTRAQAGIAGLGLSPTMFWRGELARLLDRYDELGIAGDWRPVPKTWRNLT